MDKVSRDTIEVLQGITYKIKTPCGNMYVTVNKLEDKIIEVFAKLGKAGGCPQCNLDGLCRVISIALQEGTDINRIIKTLLGHKCLESGIELPDEGLSCPDAVGKILKKENLNESKK